MANQYKLNCDGLVCPLPVAKTKRKLSEMNQGDILEVKGDFPEAGENIKRFVENQGHRVIKFNIDGNNFYLKIEKQ